MKIDINKMLERRRYAKIRLNILRNNNEFNPNNDYHKQLVEDANFRIPVGTKGSFGVIFDEEGNIDFKAMREIRKVKDLKI